MMRAIIIPLLIVMTACTATKFNELNHSSIGFIGDYSKFNKVDTNDGLKSFRYSSDKIKSGFYNKIFIEPVAFYPQEVASGKITQGLLTETKAYIDIQLGEVIASYFEIVEHPQVGALTVTPRIAAIKTTAGDIALKEMIPIGSIIALSKAATGFRHQNVEVFMEIKATDSIDGEFVGGSVKQGKGAPISGIGGKVTLESIRPLLDVWVRDAHDIFKQLSNIQSPL
jgi:hypothetical protein